MADDQLLNSYRTHPIHDIAMFALYRLLPLANFAIFVSAGPLSFETSAATITTTSVLSQTATPRANIAPAAPTPAPTPVTHSRRHQVTDECFNDAACLAAADPNDINLYNQGVITYPFYVCIDDESLLCFERAEDDTAQVVPLSYARTATLPGQIPHASDVPDFRGWASSRRAAISASAASVSAEMARVTDQAAVLEVNRPVSHEFDRLYKNVDRLYDSWFKLIEGRVL